MISISHSSRQAVAAFAVVAFLAPAFFSFAFMTYGSDGRMQGDCPFSVMGVSLCPQDAQTAAIHHISTYQSFLSVPVGSGITALIIALVLAFVAALIFLADPPWVNLPTLMEYFYHYPPPVSSHTRKITRWLSLLENSPSLVLSA